MGRITADDRKRYADKVEEYKGTISQGLAREKTLAEVLRRDPTGAGYKLINLAEETMVTYSWQLLLNSLSLSLLGIRNEDWLSEARKTLYRAIKYLEDAVTPFVDVPFSDYEPKLEEIADFSAEARYLLIRKLGFAISELEAGYGDNSKWRWSFVDIWAKFATIAKNFLNLKTLMADIDMDSPIRSIVTDHLNLVKKLYQQTADRYREKYELSSSRPEDFDQAILYLSGLRRLAMVLGERDEAETLKKKIEVWKNKKEADAKKREQLLEGKAAGEPKA